jgi:hypothetical protein
MYIRLWRIGLSKSAPKSLHELGPGEEIQVEEKVFAVQETTYSIKLESILLCHNAWIQSVVWNRDGM